MKFLKEAEQCPFFSVHSAWNLPFCTLRKCGSEKNAQWRRHSGSKHNERRHLIMGLTFYWATPQRWRYLFSQLSLVLCLQQCIYLTCVLDEISINNTVHQLPVPNTFSGSIFGKCYHTSGNGTTASENALYHNDPGNEGWITVKIPEKCYDILCSWQMCLSWLMLL